jgi:hypothetical protein
MKPSCEIPGCTSYAFRFNGRMLCEEHAQELGLSACGKSCNEDPGIKVAPALGEMLRPVNSIETVCVLWNAKHKRRLNRAQANRIANSGMKKILSAFAGGI